MKTRIRMIQESKQMSQREFADALGISPSSLSSIYNGHTSPTNNHVQAIHRRFPEISITWLLFGEGEMVQRDDAASTSAPAPAPTVAPADRLTGGLLFSDFTDGQQAGSPEAVPPQSAATEGIPPGQVVVREIVKYTDKPQHKITEIRVFYDDGTFDTFSGKRE